MTIKECTAWLNEHDDILILTHVRPDGDTLGGAAALCSAMRRTAKMPRYLIIRILHRSILNM